MAIGVLHHLPDPERAFRSLVPFARPGGWVHVYLYWVPARGWHRLLLGSVTAGRRVTTRMPRPLLHALCYPLAAALYLAVVIPNRLMRRRPRLSRLAASLPLQAYPDYPFAVLVNDTFDRFSAPIEHRYTAQEVEAWFRSAGLEEISVIPKNGWVASGQRPDQAEGPGPSK